jgi:nitrate reductase alpha subunit
MPAGGVVFVVHVLAAAAALPVCAGQLDRDVLRASDLGGHHAALEHADWKTVVLDVRTGAAAVPNGSVGHRCGSSDEGRWNLRLDGIEQALTLLDLAQERVAVDLPRFDVGESEGGSSIRRGVPAIRIGGQLVTTVLDLRSRSTASRGLGRRATGLRATTTRRRRARRRGRSRSPASRGDWRRGWRASLRATRRSPRGAR